MLEPHCVGEHLPCVQPLQVRARAVKSPRLLLLLQGPSLGPSSDKSLSAEPTRPIICNHHFWQGILLSDLDDKVRIEAAILPSIASVPGAIPFGVGDYPC
jgi:hypothetical protein